VWTSHGFGKLAEERSLDFEEFGRIQDFEDVFDFIQEEDLLCAADFGPETQQSEDYLY
jgi:hypothetical protein